METISNPFSAPKSSTAVGNQDVANSIQMQAPGSFTTNAPAGPTYKVSTPAPPATAPAPIQPNTPIVADFGASGGFAGGGPIKVDAPPRKKTKVKIMGKTFYI